MATDTLFNRRQMHIKRYAYEVIFIILLLIICSSRLLHLRLYLILRILSQILQFLLYFFVLSFFFFITNSIKYGKVIKKKISVPPLLPAFPKS